MTIFTSINPNVEKDVYAKNIKAPAYFYGRLMADSILYECHGGNHSQSKLHPIDENSQFALFSITKIFTSIAILQLIDNKQLELDQKAIMHLPQYAFLKDITIRQLLSHQSGLNNPLPINWIHLADEDSTFDYPLFSHSTLISYAKNKIVAGKKSTYSNLNFLLLGEIVEKITNMPYQAYITNNVLKDNSNIGFKWHKEQAITGYHKRGFSSCILGLIMNKQKFTEPKIGNYIPFKTTYINGAAYGGLIGNSTGLTYFLQSLLKRDSSILSNASYNQMYTEQLLKNGEPSGHSLGWFVGELNGHKFFHHAGGGGGFYAEVRIYPDLGMASYLLTNSSGFSDKRILNKLDTNAFSSFY